METCSHLFFDYVVAKVIWSDLRGNNVSFEVVAGMWLCDKKYMIENCVQAAALWVIWTIRNDLCFNLSGWLGMQVLWRKLAYLLSQWKVLFSEHTRGRLEAVVGGLENLAQRPPPL